MKKLKLIGILTFSSLLFACGGNGEQDNKIPYPDKSEKIDLLWKQTVNDYLDADLWNSVNNYDAAHVLMIPLHFAFSNSNSKYISQFEDYFHRYLKENNLDEETNQLRKLQYLYLHSQYLKLKAENQSPFSKDDVVLFEELVNEVDFQWNDRIVRTYGGNEFKGMQERLRFKINNLSPEPEYARAIFDEEFYLLAIASDLMFIDEGSLVTKFDGGQEILFDLFVQDGLETHDGWLFQVGVWSDYVDYIYAGHTSLASDLNPMIIEDVATDSSHFHRMPLWIQSYTDGYIEDSDEHIFFERLITQLKKQFENYVLVTNTDTFPAPRVNNYSDGWNGIYRYHYDTVGESMGYGPYELSGVLPFSWYAFLDSDTYKSSLRSTNFPLPDAVIEVYTGPNTTRERHPLVVRPDYYTNGFAELHVLLAIEL